MSEFEPRPLLVMRNQLLAFALLNLLGSCAHLPQTVAASAVKPATTAETSGSKLSPPAVLSLPSRLQSPVR